MTRSGSTRCRRGDRSAVRCRRADIRTSVAQPRRAHAGRHATPDGGSRDPRRRPRSGAARRCRAPRTCGISSRFTPDGRFLVGGSWKGWAQLWSTKTWKPVGRRFTGHAGRVEWPSVSPDGEHARHGRPGRHDPPVGPAHAAAARRPAARPAEPASSSPQFTPDGAYLFAIYGDGGRAYRWDVRPSSWARHACTWPAARSPDPSGRTPCPSATTRRPARANEQIRSGGGGIRTRGRVAPSPVFKLNGRMAVLGSV